MLFNYINKPKLYNTGFLLDDRISRQKQNLMSQELSNNCFVGIKRNVNDNFYDNYNITEKNLMNNPYYNNRLFPVRQPYANYGGYKISNNCECLLNIKAP